MKVVTWVLIISLILIFSLGGILVLYPRYAPDPLEGTVDWVRDQVGLEEATESAEMEQVVLPADLSPETLSNMSYTSDRVESGTVMLVNGRYTEGSVQVAIEQSSYPLGVVNGNQSALSVLEFTDSVATEASQSADVMLVQDVNGVATHVATVEGVAGNMIINQRFADNQVEVNVIEPQPDSKFTQYMRYYDLVNGELVLANEAEVITAIINDDQGVRASQVTFSPPAFADTVEGRVEPVSPYDDSMPPGPVGGPAYVVQAFDTNDFLRVYQIDEWAAMWERAGNSTVSDTVADLVTILKAKAPNNPVPMPVLPFQGGINDLAARQAYVSHQSGEGVRFVGRVGAQSQSPYLRDQMRYVYQGITKDGRSYISFIIDVQTDALPETTLSAEDQALYDSDFEAYRNKVEAELNALSPGDFEPSLDDLDSFVESLRIVAPLEPTATPGE